MTDRSDLDRVLRHWFEDGPSTMPDRVVDVVAHRISVRPQRRTWRLLGRLTMTPALKYGIASAAVLVVALVGYNLLPKSGSIGGPGATPTPVVTPTAAAVASLTATPTPFPCGEDVAGCGGRLTAGTHGSTNFKPAVTFTTPDGWTNSLDTPGNYELDSIGTSYLLLWSDVDISQHTATCEPLAEPGQGNTVQDWIDFVTTHPGMNAGPPVAVDLGDAKGQAVDLTIKAGWTKTCSNLPGPSVQFIMHADGSGGTYGAASWISLRLNVLDIGAKTILVEEYGTDTGLESIVSSMRFAIPH